MALLAEDAEDVAAEDHPIGSPPVVLDGLRPKMVIMRVSQRATSARRARDEGWAEKGGRAMAVRY